MREGAAMKLRRSRSLPMTGRHVSFVRMFSDQHRDTTGCTRSARPSYHRVDQHRDTTGCIRSARPSYHRVDDSGIQDTCGTIQETTIDLKLPQIIEQPLVEESVSGCCSKRCIKSKQHESSVIHEEHVIGSVPITAHNHTDAMGTPRNSQRPNTHHVTLAEPTSMMETRVKIFLGDQCKFNLTHPIPDTIKLSTELRHIRERAFDLPCADKIRINMKRNEMVREVLKILHLDHDTYKMDILQKQIKYPGYLTCIHVSGKTLPEG